MQFLPKLPKLRELSVDMRECYGDAEKAAVVAAVQRATQITALDWNCRVVRPRQTGSAAENAAMAANHSPPMPSAVLAGLPRLRKLRVNHPGIPESELSKWTALTYLEQLQLSFCGEGATDSVVVALASKLRKLQHLKLVECGSLSQAVWPALGGLTALSRLDVQLGSPFMRDQDLQHLTSLTALGFLRVLGKVSDEAEASFLAAMPQLTRRNLWLSEWLPFFPAKFG